MCNCKTFLWDIRNFLEIFQYCIFLAQRLKSIKYTSCSHIFQFKIPLSALINCYNLLLSPRNVPSRTIRTGCKFLLTTVTFRGISQGVQRGTWHSINAAHSGRVAHTNTTTPLERVLLTPSCLPLDGSGSSLCRQLAAGEGGPSDSSRANLSAPGSSAWYRGGQKQRERSPDWNEESRLGTVHQNCNRIGLAQD